MPVSPECIAAVRAASGDQLSDAEARDLILTAERKRDRLLAEGRLDRLDSELRDAVAKQAEEERLAAILKRKHVALNAIARDKLERTIEARTEGKRIDPAGAVLSIFEGTVKNVREGRVSVQARKLGYEGRFFGDMMARVVGEKPHVERLLRDKAFNDDLAREAIQPGSTRNADARFMAEQWAEFSERSRLDLNRLGANIGRLDGYLPQSHDAARILKAGQEAWVDAVIPKIDLQRTFPDATPDEARAILRDVWTTIVTGRGRGSTAKGRGEVTGPANLANSLGEHRVLHFRSADDWLAYNGQFGEGNAFSAIVSHQQRAARMAALMDVLGPNPEVMLNGVLDTLQRKVRDGDLAPEKKAGMISKLGTDGTAIGRALDEAMGLTLSPVNITAANIGGGIRAVQSMAKLGGAVISSLSDVVTRAAAMTYQGKPVMQTYADQIGDFLQGRGAGEQRQIAYLLGEGFDGIIDHIVSPHVAGDTAPGRMQQAMSAFFRYSGLSGWTDIMRASQARMASAWLGQNAGKEFDKLPAQLRRVFDHHGIEAGDWEKIRATAWQAENGRTYITPDRLDSLPVELKLRDFYADETGFGVIETDAAARRVALQGTRPGTPVGEAARFIMQFKGFPIAFTQRVLGRAFLGGEGENGFQRLLDNKAHIGHLVAGLTVAGYASMTAKDYLAGRTARDPSKPETILAALMQGGGAGIYGDFLFAQASRFGGGTLETIAGPTIGTGAQIVDLWLKARDGEAKAGEALNLALQNTPFANLWYARPVLDMLVLNSLREGLSPGFLARQERQRREDYGQEYWAPRTLF